MRIAEALGVVIPIPSGWQDRSQLILVSESYEGFRPNIVVAREELADRTMEQFLEQHLENLRRTFEGLDVGASAPAVLGPHQGHLIEYNFTANKSTYRQQQFMIVARQTVYTFTYSHLADKFESNLGIMERIVSTARIAEEDGDRTTDEFLG